jgi:hypothetical protein
MPAPHAARATGRPWPGEPSERASQSAHPLGAVAQRAYGSLPQRHSTTVLCIQKDGEVGAPPHDAAVVPSFRLAARAGAARPQVVMMADGQVTAGSMVVKPNARKLRRLGEGVVGGFAGARLGAQPGRGRGGGGARRLADPQGAAPWPLAWQGGA